VTSLTRDFFVNLAANLAYDLIKASTVRLGTAMRGDAEREALQRIYNHAFVAMVTECLSDLSDEMKAHVGDLLRGFVSDPEVSGLLLDLVLAGEDPPVAKLQEKFEDQGFDTATLPIDFNAAMASLLKGLGEESRREAANDKSPLFNRISLGRLTAIQVLLERNQGWPDILNLLHEMEQAIRDIIQPLAVAGSAIDGLVIGAHQELIQRAVAKLPLDLQSLAEEVYSRIHEGQDGLREALRAQALGNYLSALAAYCEQLPYITLPGKPLPLLSTIYIEQRAKERSTTDRSADLSVEEERAEARMETIDQALTRHRHLMLEGAPGMGKSTLLRNLALRLVARREHERALLVPIVVSARNLATRTGSFSESLSAQVNAELGKLLHTSLPEDFFASSPSDGCAWLVMIDGLDEVISPIAREHMLNAIVHHGERVDGSYRFVLTTRPLPAVFQTGQHSFGQYTLRPFEAGQVRSFARLWFAERQNGDEASAEGFLRQVVESRISELAQTPLLLTMAAIVYELSRDEAVPTRRGELYHSFVRVLLEDEESNRETRSSFRREWDKRYGREGEGWADQLFNRRRQILQHLALWAQDGSAGSYVDETIRYAYEQRYVPERLDKAWMRSQAEILLRRTGLMVQEGEHLGFIHSTFGEYLAAFELAHQYDPRPENWARSIRWQAKWREVTLFLLGIWSSKGHDVSEALHYARQNGGNDGLLLSGLALAEGVRVKTDVDLAIINALLDSTRLLGLGQLANNPNSLDILSKLNGRLEVRSGLVSLANDSGLWFAVREAAVRSLVTLGCIPEACDAWLSQANDETLEILARHRAVLGLRLHGSVDRLLTLASQHNVNPLVRFWAARALIKLGVREVVAPIVMSLIPQLDVKTLVQAAKELWTICAPDELRQLRLHFASDRSIDQSSLLQTATELKKLTLVDEARSLLLYLAQSAASPEVRKKAIDAAASICSADLISSLRLSLAEDSAANPGVRAQAIRALKPANLVDDVTRRLLTLAKGSAADPAIRVIAVEKLRQSCPPNEIADIWFSLANDQNIPKAHRLHAAIERIKLGLNQEMVAVVLSLVRDTEIKLSTRMDALNQIRETLSHERFARIWLSFKEEDGVASAAERVRIAAGLKELGFTSEGSSMLLELLKGRGESKFTSRVEINACVELAQLGLKDDAKSHLSALVANPGVSVKNRLRAADVLKGLVRPADMAPIWTALSAMPGTNASQRMHVLAELQALEGPRAGSRSAGDTPSSPAQKAGELTPDGPLNAVGGKSIPHMTELPVNEPYGLLNTAIELRERGLIGESKLMLLSLAGANEASLRVRMRAASEVKGLCTHGELARIWLRFADTKALDDQQALLVAIGLLELGLTPEARTLLLRVAQSPSAPLHVRTGAIERLEATCSRDEMIRLWLSLVDTDALGASDRLRIATRLSTLGRPEHSVRILVSIAQDAEVDGAIRMEAVEALREAGHTDDIVQLWYDLVRDSTANSEVRLRAAKELNQCGIADYIIDAWYILAYDQGVSASIRMQAVEGLLEIALEDDAIAILLSLVKDPTEKPEIRAQAIRALGRLGEADKLLNLASDPSIDLDVRRNAVKTVGHVGEYGILRKLVRLAGSGPDKEIRRAAQRALDQVRKRIGVPDDDPTASI
jgi:hypothetical protein